MKINYDKYRKFILLIPVILILLAVVIGVVFKFNISKEFTTTYKFTVSYNTTITESNYEKCEEICIIRIPRIFHLKIISP